MTKQVDTAPARSPLLTYEMDDETQLESAVVDAFRELGVNVDDRDPLYEFVPPDPVRTLLRRSETPVTVSTVVWGYVTVIEPGRLRIFETPDGEE
jgi:hypothetical protein